jgi:hypothetical protein
METTHNDVLLEAHAILDGMGIPDDERSLVDRLALVASQWERRQRGKIYGLTDVQVTRLYDVFNAALEWSKVETARDFEHAQRVNPQAEQNRAYLQQTLFDAVRACNRAFIDAFTQEHTRDALRTKNHDQSRA